MNNSIAFITFNKEESQIPMYYLVIQNLGRERCIHCSEEDIYSEGSAFSCTPDLDFHGIEMVKEISIRCIEAPDPPLRAMVFRD